jgi:hypothetical protein
MGRNDSESSEEIRAWRTEVIQCFGRG